MEREKQTKTRKKENPFNMSLKTLGGLVTGLQLRLSHTLGRVRRGIKEMLEETLDRRVEKSGLVAALSAAALLLTVTVAASARFPLGVYPAGFALAAAAGGGILPGRSSAEKKRVRRLEAAGLVTVFSGVLLASAFQGKDGFTYLVTTLILMLLRFLMTGGRFCDSVLSRVTLSAAVSVGTGLFLSLMGGFTVNSVFAAVAMGLLTPVLTYLLCGFFLYRYGEESGTGESLSRSAYLASGLFALVYLVLYAIREVSLLNFSPAFLMAVWITLLAARKKGPLWGGAWGMVTGMAGLSPLTAPALAVGGFFAGLFFRFSAPAALMISFVTAGGYCMFTGGFSVFGELAADYLMAATLFLPLLRLPLAEETKRERGSVPLGQRETVRRARESLQNVSEAFSSLSQVFYTVSESMKKPCVSELSRLVSQSFESLCSGCQRSGLCWGRERETLTALELRAASALMNRGEVRGEDLGQTHLRRCPRTKELLEDMNRRYLDLAGGRDDGGKAGLLAGEYSAVSRLMKSTAGELNAELEANPKWEKKAREVLSRLGIRYGRVCVFGTRNLRIDVYGVLPDRIRQGSDRVVLAFEEAFGMCFDDPRLILLEESVILRLARRRAIGLECAKSGCAKRGESVSGDSVSFFETKGERFYSLVCDGMGSGRDAAFASRLAAIFIEKLMQCATPKNVTLEMLNSFLMSTSSETFTTVDLLEVDLLSGDAKFIKAGAAASFVLRGDRIHRIRSLTPPAGILSRMSAEETRFHLRPGDFVLQLSDGAENQNGDRWLLGKLAEKRFSSAAELCELVFAAAREISGERDDLSVSVIRVMNNK